MPSINTVHAFSLLGRTTRIAAITWCRRTLWVHAVKQPAAAAVGWLPRTSNRTTAVSTSVTPRPCYTPWAPLFGLGIGAYSARLFRRATQVVEKEYSIEAILKELAEIQNQGPKNYCVLGTRHCSFLHQQVGLLSRAKISRHALLVRCAMQGPISRAACVCVVRLCWMDNCSKGGGEMGGGFMGIFVIIIAGGPR